MNLSNLIDAIMDFFAGPPSKLAAAAVLAVRR